MKPKMKKKIDMAPSVRGAVYDDPKLQVGLRMSLGLARLLHKIIEESSISGLGGSVIDNCLTQAIQLVESKQSSGFQQKEELSAA